jgi:two-component system sensor kinase FixL
MGELAASLAHELNQPLTGIVTNAQVGQRLLDQRKWDAAEFREILQDIADDGKRAGEVIRSVRNMVKKGELPWELLDLNDVVTKATRLIKPDGLARGCEIRVDLEPNLPKNQGRKNSTQASAPQPYCQRL